MNWSLPEPYTVNFDDELSDAEIMKGRYNVGYKVSDLDVQVENNLTKDEEYVLWTPLEGSTPEMNDQEDLMTYHLARMRNAEVMRDQGLSVPDTALIEAQTDSENISFLLTPYIEHESFEQRPKVPNGNSRRNNPHAVDPYDSPGRRNFEAQIERAMSGIDDERLVNDGKIINAGKNGIDSHNKNWGLVGDDLIRLDIGEVPAQGPIWEEMPYDSPQEFYREQDLREKARETLDKTPMNPEDSIPEELEELMDF